MLIIGGNFTLLILLSSTIKLLETLSQQLKTANPDSPWSCISGEGRWCLLSKALKHNNVF